MCSSNVKSYMIITTYFATFSNYPEVHGLYKELENITDIKAMI